MVSNIEGPYFSSTQPQLTSKSLNYPDSLLTGKQQIDQHITEIQSSSVHFQCQALRKVQSLSTLEFSLQRWFSKFLVLGPLMNYSF